jgi:Alpha/beta hydrolase family
MREMGSGARARLLVVFAAVGICFSASAARAAYAPVDRPGPALSVSPALLRASLACSAGVAHASRAPVLLVHGTGANVNDNWSWTYEPALDKLHIPWCAVDLPAHATGDVQTSAEYVVYSIRTMYARAGRRIAIIGHSQGGMLPRWALRFWPDTRKLVDDVIGFAPSNHGTTLARLACSQSCSAADWQQADNSHFTAALNSFQETFQGISYTDVYTHTDEVVQPNLNDHGSSSLHGGGGAITNVAIQDICPADANEHLTIGTIDPVAYALAVDALDHRGPADPSRIAPLVCLQGLQPGVDRVTFAQNVAAATADFEAFSATKTPAEPPLRCYVTASCLATVRLQVSASPSRVTAGRTMTLDLTVRVRIDGISQAVPGAAVTLGQFNGRADDRGRAVLRVRFRAQGGRAVIARAAGFLSGRSRLQVSAARTRGNRR